MIAADLEREAFDVIPLFWGHYPALVGRLVDTARSGSVLAIFLGEYDLATGYGLSRGVAQRADALFKHAQVNVAPIVALDVPREGLRVAYLGVAPEILSASTADRRNRDPVRLLAAARLIEEKRSEDAIEAFARIARSWPRRRR